MKYYVYKIFHEIENKYYIGSRTKSDRIDILDGYNTSSKVVRNLINEYGVEKFKIVEILEYESAELAIESEDLILKNIKDRENYLNVNFSAGGAVIKSQSHFQIYNEILDEYIYHPKSTKIPSGWIKKSSFKPPSRKGYKLIINIKTKETKYINTNKEKLENGWQFKTSYDKEINDKLEKRTEWITDGLINKKIKKSEKVPEGWILGKTLKRNKNIFINNGKSEREITPHEKIPIGWNIGNLARKRTYLYDNINFNYKKDLLTYLNMTATEFDYKLAKNKIENITVYDNGKKVKVTDRYYREKVKKENDRRGKISNFQYTYNNIVFENKTDLLTYLNMTEGVYDYKIKTKKLNVIRSKKNNGHYN